MTRGIPRGTQSFIRRYIGSIHQLETLLWLRAHSSRSITAATLAKEERLEPTMAEELLDGFSAGGFLEGPDEAGAFTYAPPPPLAERVDELADVYGTYRVSVINFVFSMPSESVQSFADAFKIRKDEDDS